MESRTDRETGRLGEKIARDFLRSRRYLILEKNYFTPFGEIDLIARKNDYTVFVEVKTRVSDPFGSPLYSITRLKQRSIVRNSLSYMKKNGLTEKPCRIDVISIILDGNKELKTLEHIHNAIESGS